ncbi:alanine--tRNA ligase [Mycoplasma sp. M5725]|uniref:Alanine--tRNA ligase n=1 Tax=Mycoplasma phocimorsus TaxID=3045839 RepID=A0AAJ1PRH5_9MOLU|nr:alanine--tRNA ligase [Mycoplasma phocimorsus]MDJ1645992.1 alanine--tRNA ligase [Mycoplasma phocimorsus]
MISSKEIRQMWLDFFKSKKHLVIPTKNLIPVNDDSLLWINSGVATLKDYFSGKIKPECNRLTNSQKAIRTNDIENVGITTRHHTFFEMLGNFSIGDYFKKEAIEWGYEFVTQWLKLPKEKIYITYYKDDIETYNLWVKFGIDKTHMVKGDRKTNFWEHGAGPCGPNTEIFFDRGEKYDQRGIELLEKDLENDRYIEIWNIVFSTFNNDGKGNYTELAQKNIDTGAGLERIVAILQDAPTNYDTDLFLPIIREIEKYTSYKYDINNYFKKNKQVDQINTAFKIIADHMRTVANAIGDGALPSNVGRGYIIRRLIRRSYYQSFILKIKDKTFLHKLIFIIQKSLVFDYDVKKVAKIVEEEEELFAKTIEKGRNLLLNEIKINKNINAQTVFKLYETYGFPFELTIEILKENNIQINEEELEKEKEIHANKSRTKIANAMKNVINYLNTINKNISKFSGYETTKGIANIIKMFDEENELEEIKTRGYIILDTTPFYATSGGQNHDEGYLLQNGNIIKILDVFKDKHNNHVHLVEGQVNKKDPVECFVDEDIRANMARNHSSTHIMFSILRKYLGNSVEQLGSDITQERFTFDYPADKKLSKQDIKNIENEFKKVIQNDVKRTYNIISLEQAKEQNVYMTLEEIKYMNKDAVRMVSFEGVTKDLCGGTHVEHTKFIEDFKIISVEKKQAGVYRIRAITSNKLVNEYNQKLFKQKLEELQSIQNKLKELNIAFSIEKFDNYSQIEKIEKHIEELKELQIKTIKERTKQEANKQIEVEEIKIYNFKILFNLNAPSSSLSVQAASLREANKESIIILASENNNASLVAISSHIINSNVLLNKLFSHLQGKGGGNAIYAMGRCAKLEKENLISILNRELNA